MHQIIAHTCGINLNHSKFSEWICSQQLVLNAILSLNVCHYYIKQDQNGALILKL